MDLVGRGRWGTNEKFDNKMFNERKKAQRLKTLEEEMQLANTEYIRAVNRASESSTFASSLSPS